MRKRIFEKTHILPDDILIHILGFIKQRYGPIILLYDFKKKKFIDTEHPDYTKAKILVQENGLLLKYVKRQLKTEEICRFAFIQNSKAIKYIRNSKAIKYIRKKIIKEELQKSALYKKQPYMFILNSFGIVRYNLKTKEFEYCFDYFVFGFAGCLWAYTITILFTPFFI